MPVLLIVLAASGCGGGGGGGGGTTSSTTGTTTGGTTTTADTTAPSVTITAPVSGGNYTPSTLPSSVSVSYADAASGVNVSTLAVLFTIKNRTLSLTDLFGTDATANASSSSTSASVASPLKRTTVSRFADTTFSAPATSWTFERAGSASLHVFPVGTGVLLVWDSAATNAKLINTATGDSTNFTFGANPLSVVASNVSGKLYAAFSGDSKIYIYDLTTPTSYTTASMSSAITSLSYNPTLNRVYAFHNTTQVDVWSCAAGSLAGVITLGTAPQMAAAVPGTTDRVATIAVAGGGVRLYVTGTGGETVNALLGLQLPIDLLIDSTGSYAFVSLSTENKVTAVNISTGAKTNITTGTEPRALIEGPSGTVLSMNAGAGTVSVINTGNMTVSSTASPGVLFVDGVYLSGAGAYFVSEDLWDSGYISDNTPLVITASVSDVSGNSESGQSTISVSAESL